MIETYEDILWEIENFTGVPTIKDLLEFAKRSYKAGKREGLTAQLYDNAIYRFGYLIAANDPSAWRLTNDHGDKFKIGDEIVCGGETSYVKALGKTVVFESRNHRCYDPKNCHKVKPDTMDSVIEEYSQKIDALVSEARDRLNELEEVK